MTPLLLLLAMAAGPSADDTITVTNHRWAPFISPMGEPFRPRAVGDDTLAAWFVQADRDRDGRLTEAEMRADAARFFATLDQDKDGAIDPTEIARYEYELAPDVQLGSKLRPNPGQPQPDEKNKRKRGPREGLQGAARYTLLNMPQPVAAADVDVNRLVTRAEFDAAAVTRFRLLDRARTGALTRGQLDLILAETRARKPGKADRGDDPRDQRVANPYPTSTD
jgi:hypothetical protein